MIEGGIAWFAGVVTGLMYGAVMKSFITHTTCSDIMNKRESVEEEKRLSTTTETEQMEVEKNKLDTLIDIALAQKDRQWFMELAQKKNNLNRRHRR